MRLYNEFQASNNSNGKSHGHHPLLVINPLFWRAEPVSPGNKKIKKLMLLPGDTVLCKRDHVVGEVRSYGKCGCTGGLEFPEQQQQHASSYFGLAPTAMDQFLISDTRRWYLFLDSVYIILWASALLLHPSTVPAGLVLLPRTTDTCNNSFPFYCPI